MSPATVNPATVSTVRRRLRRRAVLVGSALALVLLAVFVAAIAVGEYPIGVGDVIGALFGRGGPRTRYVVVRVRLPRALLGVLVGVAFGLSGAIFQRLLRNPLASPDVIGVTAGSSLAAVVGLVVFGVSGFAVPAVALAGGVVAAVLIYLLAWRRGVTGYRLVLVGIGVAAALSGAVSYFLTRADVRVAALALIWLTGSLNGADWDRVRTIGVFLVVLVPAALVLARSLAALQLGDELARGLGARVESSRLGLLAVGVALAGVGTAVAGPVAFVAFVAGPIAARLLRTGRPGLPAAALTGALVTLVADFVAQHLLGGAQLPVGVVTGAVGAPYLLYLLAKANGGVRA
ncbi:iron chelate uptake ABC transporter family permease subunit [Amycolatopsis sp. PS_44_ISF1]|uniref:FecCD family ABC transporter permease n=1 Tax=Amycolatopsis sp. PS_44_ISF1 TaxID=2974917 RepID=UPI0028DFCB8A|nr:iron chelate uptake ABC transporter family permease subunit [Amycolatopsis sp. PS_44_ISF1]MDT8913056.1 iron chelate uptake ABC transporter family permease subunit [Amycolatopsis sp. PS_44_ISF1]